VIGTVEAFSESGDEIASQLAELFARRPGLTGLVVHNEAAVGPVLSTLRELGRRVPDDVSVLAICPDELAERTTPPLDSVLIPAEEVGARAVELLMRKLDNGTVPGSSLLAPRLTVRASSSSLPSSVRS
jgi:DNA-binding LacI/PurR family transcriptional regulator